MDRKQSQVGNLIIGLILLFIVGMLIFIVTEIETIQEKIHIRDEYMEQMFEGRDK